MPGIGGDRRGIAHRHGPCRGRVPDHRTLARDQRAVVGRIVPALRIRRQVLHEPLRVFQRLTHRVRLHLDLAVLIDHLGAIGGKDGAGSINAVPGGAQPDAERLAGLVAGFGRFQHRLIGPGLGLRRLRHVAGRIHLHDVEPSRLFQDADAAGWPLVLAAPAARNRDPLALALSQVRRHRVGRAALCLQAIDHVIDRLQQVGLVEHHEVEAMDHVVAGFGLRLGIDGQQGLAALRGDEVGLHLDLVLVGEKRELALQLGIAGRYPVVPGKERHLTGGAGGADMHPWQGRRGCTEFERLAPSRQPVGKNVACHTNLNLPDAHQPTPVTRFVLSTLGRLTRLNPPEPATMARVRQRADRASPSLFRAAGQHHTKAAGSVSAWTARSIGVRGISRGVRRNQRTKPSNSPFAQASTWAMGWPDLILASMVGSVPRL